MGTHNHRKKARRPGIKSDLKKLPGGLDWSNSNRNASTLKRIAKAIDDENDIPVSNSQSITEWEEEHGRGFWGNETTGYIYDKDNQ